MTSISEPPPLPIPEITYTVPGAECSDFVWDNGAALRFKVRFTHADHHPFTKHRVWYEARDQSGAVVLDSGDVGNWTGSGNPGQFFEESIYLGRDKAQRTRKIIFHYTAEIMPGVVMGH